MRYLWLTQAANQWCFPKGRHPDGIKHDALAAAVDQLNAFVLGKEIEKDFDFKHLTPQNKEVWEIRSHLNDAQLRLFGWFPLANHFIVVHGKARKQLEPQSGPKWDRTIQKVIDVRNELLPGEIPYSGFSFEDYIN